MARGTEISCDPIVGIWKRCPLSTVESRTARPRHGHQARQETVGACRGEGKTGPLGLGGREIGVPHTRPANVGRSNVHCGLWPEHLYLSQA